MVFRKVGFADTNADVAVLCLPTDIPEYIEIAVDDLGIGDVLTVADLQPPK